MNKRALLAIPLALLISNGAQAQEWYWGLSYGVASTTSDTKDFIDDTSWRNWGLDILARVKPNTAVGMYFGWNVFNDITDEVTSLDNAQIWGTQFRYINSFPMLVTVRQFTGSPGSLRFYYGGGVGAQYDKNRVDVGQWRIEDNQWHFAVAPEIGVLLPAGPDAKWFVNFKYDYAFKAADRTRSYFQLNIGVAWQTGGY